MNKTLLNKFASDVKAYLTSLPKEKALEIINFVERYGVDNERPSYFAKRFECNPTPSEYRLRKELVQMYLPFSKDVKYKYEKAYHEKMKVSAKEPHEYVMILPHGMVMPTSLKNLIQSQSIKIPLFFVKKDFNVDCEDQGLLSIMRSYYPYKEQLKA